jgi:hypothetical protein
MKYFGDALNLNYERLELTDEILIEQQHCGGNTLTVFKGSALPGQEFSFVSHRHPGFPFSLNMYVNGRKDCRVSTCCEYKHTRNMRLGSKGGQFAITGVLGGGPCRKCLLKIKRRKARKQQPLSKSTGQKVLDPNDHDYYSLKISVEGDDMTGVRVGEEGLSEGEDTEELPRSANTHDYYALKVSIEDDDGFDKWTPEVKPRTVATAGWK